MPPTGTLGRGRRREMATVPEFLEAVGLEKYTQAYASVASVRDINVEPLRRAGGSAAEAKRLNTSHKLWATTLSQPPPSWVLQLNDEAANQAGVYQNVEELLAIGAVPKPGAVVRMDAPGPAADDTAMRSATMMGLSRQAYSTHGGAPAAATPEKIDASLRAVDQFLTPAAKSAPWLLRSLDHADAVSILKDEDIGCFVVRFSARATGHFVLAYKVILPDGKDSIQNAYIRGSASGVALQTRDDAKFPTLVALLEHYTSSAGKGVFPKLEGCLRYIRAARGPVVAISDVVRQSTDTDDFDDDPTDGFGDDQDAAIEDQRERLESPPVSFDDIGEAHQEIDVYIAALAGMDSTLITELTSALEAKGLKVWCKDEKMPHMRTQNGWRQRAYKMEAVISQNCHLAVVLLDERAFAMLREPFVKDPNVPFLELSQQSAHSVVPVLVGDVSDPKTLRFPDTFPAHDWSGWTVRKVMKALLANPSTTYTGPADVTRTAAFIDGAFHTEKKRGSEKQKSTKPARSQYANFDGSLLKTEPPKEKPSKQDADAEDAPPVPSRDNRRPMSVVSRTDDLTWFSRRPDAECKAMVEGGPDGTFLVRESRSVGSYVLCVRDEGEAVNYLMRLEEEPRGYHFAERIFGSIPEIIFTFRATPFLAQSGHTLVLASPPIGCIPFEGPTESVHAQDSATDQFWAEWSIQPEQIVLRKRLGQGEFGEVWAGLLKGVGEHSGLVAKVAVKKLKDERLHEGFLAEAKIMTELDHNNLVRIYGVSTKGSMLIIAELCHHGSLKDYLQGRFDKTDLCEESTLRRFAFDVCLGMQYLEDREFVHRDLAARNVLVTAEERCKVADFGLSKHVAEEGEYKVDITNSKLPIRWTAPEALLRGSFSTKSDVWAYGITLYEISTHGAIPYPGKSNKEVLEAVLHENFINPRMEGMSEDLYSLMKLCWRMDRDHRPTFRQLAARLKQLTGAQSMAVDDVTFGEDSDSDDVC